MTQRKEDRKGGRVMALGPYGFASHFSFQSISSSQKRRYLEPQKAQAFRGTGFPSPPTLGGITIGPRKDPSPCPLLGDFFPAPEPGIEYLEGSHQSQEGVVDS